MAARHPSPPAGMQMHHGPSVGSLQPGVAPQPQQWATHQQMAAMNEAVWLQIGKAPPCEEGYDFTNTSISESH